MTKRLLIVAHAPSANTERLRAAARAGAQEIGGVDVALRAPMEAVAEDVLAADALLLGTPENLGYMSGALKDFFDRIYYPCLERKQGLPYALYIRAGQGGGDGTRVGVERIVTGLRWRAVQEPLVFRGPWREEFADDARELGMALAAGLEAGVF